MFACKPVYHYVSKYRTNQQNSVYYSTLSDNCRKSPKVFYHAKVAQCIDLCINYAQKAVEKMGPAIKNILQFVVKNGARVWVNCAALAEFQVFIMDFRSMTKHGNSVKPNLSLHNTKVAFYHLHHIRIASKLPWLRNKG